MKKILPKMELIGKICSTDMENKLTNTKTLNQRKLFHSKAGPLGIIPILLLATT